MSTSTPASRSARPSASTTSTSRSAAPSSTENAAAQFGCRAGPALSAETSMSCG
ncbi:hypothetical protein OG349_01940 [Streptomyces sp. NBC_01317]|uniref:hypothetical protein n=1 Tax=Streptomyces sp. NBC_01317 TaxID=2903822 RepID=UPI002E12B425|nr:hypothetical protein OG349_01940 [Streptomyces sp. NBC_01317]